MDELIDSPGEAQMFSKMDTNRAGFHIAVDVSDHGKTAFTSQNRFYQLTCLQFCVKNSPILLQHIMDNILSCVKYKFALLHLDEILIMS